MDLWRSGRFEASQKPQHCVSHAFRMWILILQLTGFAMLLKKGGGVKSRRMVLHRREQNALHVDFLPDAFSFFNFF